MPDAFRVVALSRALLSTGLLPSLAFGPTELLTYLNVDEFNVLILHLEIVGPGLRAALGRAGASSKQAAAPPAQVLRWGPLRMDLGRREAWWAARRLDLTSMQFRLLATLALAKGCVVPALELSRRAFGSAVAHDEERVQAHVRRIRKLIEADPSHPRFLVTVRGEGFRLAGIPCQATAGCWTAASDHPTASSGSAASLSL